MKKILVLAALLGAISLLADKIIYFNDFESYENGNIITQDSNWSCIYGSVSDTCFANVSNGGYESGKCLRYCASSLFGTHVKLTGTAGHSSTNDIKVSFMVRCDAQGAVNFNSNDGLGEFQFGGSGAGAFKINATGSIPFSSTNTCPMDTWVPVVYVMNSAPGNAKLLYVQFGDAIYEDLDISLGNGSNKDEFPNFRFFCWGGNQEYKIDNLKVELVKRNVGEIKLSVTGEDCILLDSSSVVWKIYNEGTKDATVTFTPSKSFVTVQNQNPYTVDIPASGNVSVTLKCDRKQMGNDYYRCNVALTAEGASLNAPLYIQSGTANVGYTYYKSYFDEMETGMDIRQADKAWVNGYGTPDTCPITDLEGGKAVTINYKGFNALHVRVKSKSGTSDEYNYVVSFKAFYPAGFGSWSQYNIGESAMSHFEITMNGNEENGVSLGCGTVDAFDMGGTAPIGQWFDVSYTFNGNPDNRRLLSVTLGDITKEFNASVSGGKDTDVFDYWRFFGWCNENSPYIYVKDVVIEAVARPDVGPSLEVGKGGQVLLAEKSATLTVLNAGTGTLEFEAEVTQGDGWLSIREASEETGILEDSIVGSGSKKYNLDIARDELGNDYGFGQVTVTGAGETKTINYFVQSGDETGATLYYNDFDSMELGNIKLSDPAWSGADAATVEVDPSTGGNCLKFAADNQRVNVNCKPASGTSKEYNYCVTCKVKYPDGASGPYFVMGTDLAHGMGEYGLGVNDSGNVKFSCGAIDNNPFDGVTVPTGEWFDFGYTWNANPDNRRLLSLTFGDQTVELSDILNVTCKEDFFNEWMTYTFGNGDLAPYYIDDLRVSMVPKDKSKPGVMEIKCSANPIPYTENQSVLTLLNAGGRDYTYTAEVTGGSEWLSLSSYSGTVSGSATITATADRSKIGYGFHRATIVFTTSESQVETLVMGVQGGSAKDGYVLYSSDFNSLKLSEVTETNVINELSSQDNCWDRKTDHNCIAVVKNPYDGSEQCAKVINANDWNKYCGYELNVNAPAESQQDFDIVIAMDLLIPETFVDLPESEYEHPDAYFYVSQDNSHRQCETCLYLDQQGDLSVQAELVDISNTNWWLETRPESVTVPSGQWFQFYQRFNCQLIDYDHKTFYAFNFGENEWHMEGSNSTLSYPYGISETALFNEAMPKIKFWCYRDNADILIKNVNVSLVPKGLPEPAILGLLGLLALAFMRKR